MISLKMNKEALAFLVPVWPPKSVGIMRYSCNRYDGDNLTLLPMHLQKENLNSAGIVSNLGPEM